MQLKEFSLISPAIESGTVLKALETAISASNTVRLSPKVGRLRVATQMY